MSEKLSNQICSLKRVVAKLLARNLTFTSEDIYHENYFASSIDGLIQASSRNMTISRTNVGRWTVTLSTPHPDGGNFHPTITAEEQSNNRDVPDITIVQGTKNNPTTFNIQITTGDNGASADSYIDTPFSVGVCSPISVVTGVSFA